MNPKRKALVDKAFDRLDLDKSGVVESSDIRGIYNPSKHPAVIEGRKTEEQVLQEFLETFELHHNLKAGTEKDYKVTREEFHEYYNNVSACIDDDDYFEAMMNNAWNLSDKPVSYQGKKPWAQEIGRQEPIPKGRHAGTESQSSPLVTKTREAIVQEKSQKPQPSAYKEESKISPVSTKVQELSGSDQPAPIEKKGKFGNTVATDLPKYQNIMLERFRTKLVARGGKGVIGLEKQFKIFDLDCSGELTKDEFKNAVNDYKLGMDERDLDNLFKMFDKNNDGKISYTEFMTTIVGQMSEFRKNLVERAFESIDENNEGFVELELLKKSYNAKFHPDVKTGKKSEEEAASEFATTFDAHHNGYAEAGKTTVTKDEFISYYNKISAAIESNSYFDNMMTDTWELGIRSKVDKLPYAGVSSKIYQVDSKAVWNYDHHKTMLHVDHPLRPGEEGIAEKELGKSIYEMSLSAKKGHMKSETGKHEETKEYF